jgi:hypothetical protein
MAERFHEVRAEGVRVVLDLAVGHIRAFEVERDGRTLAPLYTAPWVDDPAIANDESIKANLRFLSGDFFCAPFGGSDDPEIPGHGWPANSRWGPAGTKPHPKGGNIARFLLQKDVQGARLIKEITLRDGHSFIYQRHIFEGGKGRITVASHPMIKFSSGGRLSFSPKAYAETPAMPLETDPAQGRYALKYPARFTDLGKAPLKDVDTTDLRAYPIAARHEDFVMLVEAPGSRLGWAAAVRPDAGDVVLSLKNPRDFPVTMLWFSNGGRDYPPWNGRNVGVLGIEEGCTYSAYGYNASIARNPLSDSGVPTALELNPQGTAEVRHVVGALPLTEAWSEIALVETTDGRLQVGDVSGRRQGLPFDNGFLY